MTIGDYKYGISYLPENCMAYKDGYRYGAYKQNIHDKEDMTIVEFLKNEEEIQDFVNKNREYSKR